MWKFGMFGEEASGVGSVTKPDTLSMLTAELSLPAAATWFVKFDLDPTNQVRAFQVISQPKKA
jgi:hypothetical protein